MTAAPTACILIIGDEILSGRTQDTNIKYIATRLAELGIKLKEARVVPDDTDAVVSAVNLCRKLYTYLFTTGGIGPTHDDITTACIAKAFGRGVIRHPDAVTKMTAFYGDKLNEARLKMAEVPDGPDVELVENHVTSAPGYRIENVFVMAGIPSIAQAMFEAAVPSLRQGDPVHSGSVDGEVREGDIAADLTAVQTKYPMVSLGSYPSVRNDRLCTSIVARATDKALIVQALGEMAEIMRRFGADPKTTAP